LQLSCLTLDIRSSSVLSIFTFSMVFLYSSETAIAFEFSIELVKEIAGQLRVLFLSLFNQISPTSVIASPALDSPFS